MSKPQSISKSRNPLNQNTDPGFILRFILIHVLTYALVGVTAFTVFNYTTNFKSSEILSSLMRPTDSTIVQMAIFFQIGRGCLLAIPFVPMKFQLCTAKYGWLTIFGFLFILTGIGSVITGPGSIEGMIYTSLPLTVHIGAGFIEITIQMLIFASVIWRWERKIQGI
ncbi:MAG: hypothetical protein ACFFFH_06885 [Candidatus Thorarchaeota archaeon]